MIKLSSSAGFARTRSPGLVEALRAAEITLAVKRLKGPMQVSLARAGLLDVIGRDRLYPTLRAAEVV